jgi:hypothetical protein
VLFTERSVFKKRPTFVEVLGYQADTGAPTLGVYRLQYRSNGHDGVVLVYYDGNTRRFSLTPTDASTHQFDHDEIVPNK